MQAAKAALQVRLNDILFIPILLGTMKCRNFKGCGIFDSSEILVSPSYQAESFDLKQSDICLFSSRKVQREYPAENKFVCLREYFW